jgi:hypothetical protein
MDHVDLSPSDAGLITLRVLLSHGASQTLSWKEYHPMSILQAALYARVSSEHQTEANTIASQVAALQERATADGVVVSDAMTFLDDG